MTEFIAKDKLSEVDFGHFSRQCQNDTDKALNELRRARREQSEANDRVSYWRGRYQQSLSYASKHGVEIKDAV